MCRVIRSLEIPGRQRLLLAEANVGRDGMGQLHFEGVSARRLRLLDFQHVVAGETAQARARS